MQRCQDCNVEGHLLKSMGKAHSVQKIWKLNRSYKYMPVGVSSRLRANFAFWGFRLQFSKDGFVVQRGSIDIASGSHRLQASAFSDIDGYCLAKPIPAYGMAVSMTPHRLAGPVARSLLCIVLSNATASIWYALDYNHQFSMFGACTPNTNTIKSAIKIRTQLVYSALLTIFSQFQQNVSPRLLLIGSARQLS